MMLAIWIPHLCLTCQYFPHTSLLHVCNYPHTNILEAHVICYQSNPTASSVLDALNSEEEISSDDNESEHYNTCDCEFTEERTDQEIEHGGTESEQGNKLTSSSSSSVPSLLSLLRAPRLSDKLE